MKPIRANPLTRHLQKVQELQVIVKIPQLLPRLVQQNNQILNLLVLLRRNKERLSLEQFRRIRHLEVLAVLQRMEEERQIEVLHQARTVAGVGVEAGAVVEVEALVLKVINAF